VATKREERLGRHARQREQDDRERRERDRPNWRGSYRLDYERDDDGRISFLTMRPIGGEGGEVIHVSATVDGRLLLEIPEA
jgi:hypothetical protein